MGIVEKIVKIQSQFLLCSSTDKKKFIIAWNHIDPPKYYGVWELATFIITRIWVYYLNGYGVTLLRRILFEGPLSNQSMGMMIFSLPLI